MIVGWQLASHMRTQLVVDALEMAAGLRQPPREGSWPTPTPDRKYTSVAYTERIREFSDGALDWQRRRCPGQRHGRGLGRHHQVGAIQGRVMASFEHAEHELLNWISWYNHERLHEELGYRPPIEFEAIHHDPTPRPCGSPEAVQPAFLGALADLGTSMKSL